MCACDDKKTERMQKIKQTLIITNTSNIWIKRNISHILAAGLIDPDMKRHNLLHLEILVQTIEDLICHIKFVALKYAIALQFLN